MNLDKSNIANRLKTVSENWKYVSYLTDNSEGAVSYLALSNGENYISGKNLTKLQGWLGENDNKYIFGHLCYDLKNEIEDLESTNTSGIDFPEFGFFVPEVLYKIQDNNWELIVGAGHELSYEKGEVDLENIEIKWKLSKQDYLEKIKEIKKLLKQGEFYEANFCHEFFAEDCEIDSVSVFSKLNALTKTPYSAFYKSENKYAMSASPEGYIQKVADKLISKPIKGTARRSEDEMEDNKLKHDLAINPKERSENIMIVDLVRNDLSKIAARNSVMVDELCKIFSFETVHQMVSTVSCKLKAEITFIDIIKATFPMGSMTGAPKVSVMKHMERLESTKRGLYSGSIGFMEPNGNFNFNVVIRTLFYDSEKKYLSGMVGGAITIKSDPELEYEETLLKAEALLKALEL